MTTKKRVKSKAAPKRAGKRPLTEEEELAKEAARYTKERDFERDAGWVSVEPTDDIRRALVAISLRLPGMQLQLLKELARREGIGYQTLMKRWLDDRLREELELRRDGKTSAKRLQDLSKELEWARREIAREQHR